MQLEAAKRIKQEMLQITFNLKARKLLVSGFLYAFMAVGELVRNMPL